MKIRKGDTVKILSGKDRGKTGTVTRMLPRRNRAIVEGMNLKKKHQRSRRQDKKGEIILLPAPLALSVLELVCPRCAKPTRVGYRRDPAAGKQRRCTRCGGQF